MTIAEILTLATNQSVARHDAELLVAYTIGKSREFVIAHNDAEITPVQERAITANITRRATGEPLAYLVGSMGFYGRTFNVTPHTLIPRADTEILVETALAILRKNPVFSAPYDVTVVDVGTGSGNIIVTLASEVSNDANSDRIGFYGTDIDANALHVAKKNADTHGVAANISFVLSDLLQSLCPKRLAASGRAEFTTHAGALAIDTPLLITANLPYVDTANKAHLLAQSESRELAFEPPHALWADRDGLAIYEQLFAQIINLGIASRAPITILCEIDPTQTDAITTIAHKYFTSTSLTPVTITTHQDLTNRHRVIQIDMQTIQPPNDC